MKFNLCGDVHDRRCPRCMSKFKTAELLQRHVAEADCLQPSSSLDAPAKKSLPLSVNSSAPPRLAFTAFKKKPQQPVCVYMDYDMFWGPVEAPEVEANKAYTTVVGRNTRVPHMLISTVRCQALACLPNIN